MAQATEAEGGLHNEASASIVNMPKEVLKYFQEIQLVKKKLAAALMRQQYCTPPKYHSESTDNLY